MVIAPRSRRVPKGEAGNACAGPLGAAIQPSLRPQPVLLSGPPCVKGRATHPLAFLRSLEKSSQRPLPLIFSAGYVDQFVIESITRRSALLALHIPWILGPPGISIAPFSCSPFPWFWKWCWNLFSQSSTFFGSAVSARTPSPPSASPNRSLASSWPSASASAFPPPLWSLAASAKKIPPARPLPAFKPSSLGSPSLPLLAFRVSTTLRTCSA